MRRLWLLVLVTCTLPALAGAATQATRSVRVTDTAVRPAQRNVAIGDSVRWRNEGRRSHRIVSDTRAWRAFTLKPGASKSVRFRKAGCYRYKVDGRRRARVAVAASCAGGGGGGSSGQTIYRYDVTVTGRAHTRQEHSGDPPGIYSNNGTVDLLLTWTSTYRNVRLKKVAGGSNTFVIANHGGLFGAGTTRLTFTHNHARTNNLGPCSGSFSLEGLASRVRVGGYRGQGIGMNFTLGSQLQLGPAQTFTNRIDSACDYDDSPRWIEFQGEPVPDIVRDGLTWEDVDPITLLHVAVDRKANRMFFPLSRLANGDGFTIRTGQIQNQGACHFGSLARVCVETFDGSLTVKLVPRRG